MRTIPFPTRFTLGALALVAACVTGCGRSHELETAQVRGKVTLDGRPLESGGVMFMPPRGRAATGVVQADGSYVIGTYRPGDGAVVGPHRVTINPYFPHAEDADDEQDMTAAARSKVFTVPRPFTGISVVVESGKENVIDIPLKSGP